MPQSSESMAALAAALAKAQAELVNPEKSLTAVIPADRAGQGERSFRYASLASGLEIIRKTLGKHEIAAVQTTAIDHDAKMVNLTTTLAHSSGEWIASDWPVCTIAETANPQRMGAALTYARRYALFTLVGIAGEDDLDAPDLVDGKGGSTAPKANGTFKVSATDSNGSRSERARPAVSARAAAARGHSAAAKTALPMAPDDSQSAAMRDVLLAEIDVLASAENASQWASAAMAKKNALASADAKSVEEAFERAMSRWIMSPQDIEATPETTSGTTIDSELSRHDKNRVDGNRIDKSVLAFSEPRRLRNREHLRFVARQACLLCGREPCDAHHIRYAQPRALGRKSSDEFAVPLCRIHHRAAHRVGDERKFWHEAGMDPLAIAQRLWQQTCGSGIPAPSIEVLADQTSEVQHPEHSAAAATP